MFILTPMALTVPAEVAIAVHGGAGAINRRTLPEEVEAACRAKLEEAVRAGHDLLAAGGSSVDAVVAAIMALEDSELFNAGRGSVLSNRGKVEMDASIMEGRHLNAGAVAGLQHIKNPVLLAKEVLGHSPHVMLIGEGAEAFARERGFEMVRNRHFHTERRRRQLRKAKAKGEMSLSEDVGDDDAGDDDTGNNIGTVGAVAIDRSGDMAAGTSTGGMTNKKFGRVGDSPIIGAGTYASNGVCGISATGHGEYFIRAAVAHDICARVEYQGVSLAQAAHEVVQGALKGMGAEGGVIGVDANGDIVMTFNSAGMHRAAISRSGQLTVGIFAD